MSYRLYINVGLSKLDVQHFGFRPYLPDSSHQKEQHKRQRYTKILRPSLLTDDGRKGNPRYIEATGRRHEL
ncbi:hypothetical protein M0802_004737 [Mischocyttarus mexicanus]|nr:hypothetical protein M0802_004737 [Mischocyttarus mexicanus]